ncbi:MAG: long-chain fatty acid--CoA ligase [Gammaproteobacteria bacterium]|nr:long-chain fatty acid--CoA ligase [Gammaproteobacteria bacterium]
MTHKILVHEAGNLSNLFRARVTQSPGNTAYRYFDPLQRSWRSLTWQQTADQVAHWQAALRCENLPAGSRVGIMLCNGPHWVMFEQAALGLELVVVPLYTNDRAENIAYIIHDADIKILILDGKQHWPIIQPVCPQLSPLQRIISVTPINDAGEKRLVILNQWLPAQHTGHPLITSTVDRSTLATVVYTSGTTGKPKGVMLSHHNILWNANSGSDSIFVAAKDIFLSFLPISHMLERTVGYYIPMMIGATVAYARSIELLGEDLLTIKPTILVTVPRIFERVYNKIKAQLANKPPLASRLFDLAVAVGWQRFLKSQGKSGWQPRLLLWPLLNVLVARKIIAKLGGRLRLAVSGGAPLPADIGKTFIGLGLTISQGYGLTETSPIVCTNKLDANDPTTVGQALRDVEVKLGENDELQVRSPGVMLGYWNNPKATGEVIDNEGWFHTGDKATIIDQHIRITGRIKEILVLSNGEKISPVDIEMAIAHDPLFEQVLLIGEQRPYLSAITVLNPYQWRSLAISLGLDDRADNLNHPKVVETVLTRIRQAIIGFPGYAKVFQVYNTLEAWTVENNMITPTLKLRRAQIIEKFTCIIERMYEGH